MISRLKPKGEFGRNVLTLMAGTTIAQAIPIAISPILTRIYTPEDLGVYAMYVGIAAIFAVISTGRYELAIMLPRKDADASELVMLSVGIATAVSFILMIIVVCFHEQISKLIGQTENSSWLYFMPVTVFVVGSYNSFNYWLNRKQQYKKMSNNRIIQGVLISGGQVSFGGIAHLPMGLLWADIFGRIVTTVNVACFYIRDNTLKINLIKKIALARRYKKFPKHEIPASLFNTSAFQSPFILIPMFFSTSIAGFYFLIFKSVMMPISMIGNAILDVFRSRATTDFQKHGTCRPIFIKTFTILFVVSVPFVLILMFWGQEIFGLVFGENWQSAGQYAQILAPMAMLRLISSPLSYMFFLREKLNWNMYIQFVFMVSTVVSILIGAYFNRPLVMVTLISVTGVFFYSTQVLLSYFLTEKKQKS